MLTLQNVIDAWKNGQEAETNSLSTDGERLFSYSLEIATVIDGQPIIWDYTASGSFYSRSTSRHVNMVKESCPSADVFHPEAREGMIRDAHLKEFMEDYQSKHGSFTDEELLDAAKILNLE